MLRSIQILLILIPFTCQGQNSAFSSDVERSVFNIDSASDVLLWKIKYDSAQLCWKKDISKSIKLLLQAEKIAFNDLGIYDENYLAILNDLGLAYGEIKNYKKAEHFISKSIELRTEIASVPNDRVLLSQCNLATVVLKSGNDLRAKAIFIAVIENAQKIGDEIAYMIAAENLATLLEAHEQYDSALIVVNNALVMKNGSIEDRYDLMLEKGRILRKNKKYEEAKEVFASLQQELKAPISTSMVNTIKVEQSLINIEMRLYVKAEKDLLQLYRQLKSTSSPDELLLTELTNGLGYIYEKLGIYDKSLVYYQESLDRCVTAYGYNSLNCVIMQNNIAGVYLKQGLIIEAIAAYESFIREFKNVSKEDNQTYLTAINNLAAAYRQNGQYDLALNNLQEVYSLLERNGLTKKDLAAAVLNNMAVTFTLQGEYKKASDYFVRVITIKENLFGSESPALLDVVGNLAVSYWLIGKKEESLPLFKRSLKLAKKEVNYIFPSLTVAEQIQFYQQQKQNFERFNTLSIQSAAAQPELLIQMFDNQLMLKSLMFFTNKKHNAQLDKAEPELIALSDKIQAKSVKLGQYYQMPLSELKAIKVSLPAIESEIDSLEKILRHSFHQGERQDESHAEWADIRNSLANDEALVEIIRFRKYDALKTSFSFAAKQVSIGFTDSVYYAALITSQETKRFPTLVLLKQGNQMETRFLAYHRNTLKFDIDDTLSCGNYWKPIEKVVIGKRRIYLSADGVYHLVNLNAMHDADKKFIIEKFDIHLIMNSAQLLSRVEKPAIDFSKMVMFGNPTFDSQQEDILNDPTRSFNGYDSLPGSLLEVNSIAKVLRLKSTIDNVFLGKAANEMNLKRVNSPSILHIATHGFFSTNVVYLNEQVKDDYMFHSGIILAPDHHLLKDGESQFDNDGIISAFDVMNLRLTNTDLVVISACETGLGRVENGEGVYGLQRSFLQAGAKDILVSLWKVEDVMTKDLMLKFYSYLSQKHTTRESFRLAQLDMLKDVHNPRQWAGFVMAGAD